jgi:ABC-type molybdate transport system ATPase subunit
LTSSAAVHGVLIDIGQSVRNKGCLHKDHCLAPHPSRINVSVARLMASITNEAVEELKLAKGMTVYAIIMASDVMVGID